MIGGLEPSTRIATTAAANSADIGPPNDVAARLLDHSPPRDQGNVACCVSAALATCFEILDLYPLLRITPPVAPTHYSTLFNYYYARPSSSRSDPNKYIEFSDSFYSAQSYGMCHRDMHPSVINSDTASEQPLPEAQSTAEDYCRIFFDSGYQLDLMEVEVSQNCHHIRTLLTARRAIAIGMHVPETYYELDSGNTSGKQSTLKPFNDPNRDRHAVCVVSYHDQHPNPGGLRAGALKIKDSRGNSFGEGGYWWLPYELAAQLIIEAWTLDYKPED